MGSARVILILSLLVPVSAFAQPNGERMKLAVLPTQFDASAKGQVPSLFDDYLLTAVQNQSEGYDVIGQEDIVAMLGFEAQKDILDCDDTSCMADLGGALGVDKILVVKIARLGADWVMTAKIINIKQTVVEARVNHIAAGDVKGLLQEVQVLVAKVFGLPVPPGATSTSSGTAPVPTRKSSPGGPSGTSPPAVETAANTGWAMAAGIMGTIAAGLTLVFTGAAAANADNQIAAIPLGLVALSLTGVFTPVTYAGAKSARVHSGVNGSTALRVIGWIAYGVGLANGLGLILLGLLDTDVPWEIIVSTGSLGAAGTLCMAIDAFISRSQAKSLQARASASSSEGLAWAPWWSVRFDPARSSAAPVLGVSLTY